MKRILILFFIMATSAMTDAKSQGKPAAPAAAPPAAAAPAAARNDPGVEPNIVRDVGLKMARVVDLGQVGQLWDGGSPVLKRAVTRDAFVANITRMRKGYEQPVSREWSAITRQQEQGGTLPPGKYMSVRFLTAFSGNRILRELISFRQDEDGTWRFVGYANQ